MPISSEKNDNRGILLLSGFSKVKSSKNLVISGPFSVIFKFWRWYWVFCVIFFFFGRSSAQPISPQKEKSSPKKPNHHPQNLNHHAERTRSSPIFSIFHFRKAWIEAIYVCYLFFRSKFSHFLFSYQLQPNMAHCH